MATILVVEDNEVNQRILVRRLTKRGYDVVLANDGADGVADDGIVRVKVTRIDEQRRA